MYQKLKYVLWAFSGFFVEQIPQPVYSDNLKLAFDASKLNYKAGIIFYKSITKKLKHVAKSQAIKKNTPAAASK